MTSVAETPKPAKKSKSVQRSAGKPARLNYNDRKELESLSKRIDELEQQQREFHTAMAAPAFFKQQGSVIAKAKSRLDAVERELSELFSRWEDLSARE